jgi:hypothetical protein
LFVLIVPACSDSATQRGTPSSTSNASVPPTSTTVTVAPSAPPSYALVPRLDRLSRPKPGAALPEPREDLTTHGGLAVGVYFAVLTGPKGNGDYAAFSAGWAQLNAADAQLKNNFGGRYFGQAVTDCDPEVVPALAAEGIHDVVGYVVLHFPDEAAARAFANGVDPAPIAVATVHTFCRD